MVSVRIVLLTIGKQTSQRLWGALQCFSSIAGKMSESPDHLSDGNGNFSANNQDSSYMEYTVCNWGEVEDLEMAEIPMEMARMPQVEVWEDP